jgi:hypothetical protein
VPALARVFVRATLHAWHEDSLVQDAELIVSELTGNAVAASAGTDGRPVYVGGRIPVIRVCGCVFLKSTILWGVSVMRRG